MRAFELIVLSLLGALLLGRIAFARKAWYPPVARLLLIAALAALAAHAGIERPRWQFAPLYAVAAWAVLLGWVRWRPWTARGLDIAGLAALFLAGLLGGVLPVPVLPPPAGPYAVGTASYFLVDPERIEALGEPGGGPRQIMMQVWYPAVPAPGAEPAPWLPNAEAYGEAILGEMHLPVHVPGWVLSHLALVQSNAYEDAPAAGASQPFPILVYSHGWTGFRNVAADQCEHLASHGYVVAAPDHTYGAIATQFPDGRVVPFNPKAMPPKEPADARQAGIEKLVDAYAGDLRFVLDILGAMHRGELPSPLEGRLDFTRVGLWGHSTGGGAVVETRVMDPRVRAVAGLDPWVEPVSPALRTRASAVPFLSLRCENWMYRMGPNSGILDGVLGAMTGEKHDLYIDGTRHADFVMMPLLSPLVMYTGQTGRLRGPRILEITRGYLLAFFDHHLRATGASPLPDPAAYPEVHPAAELPENREGPSPQ